MSKRFFSEAIDHWRLPNGDGCHDECPVCEEEEFTQDEWMTDVGLGNTRLGFVEWREHNLESQRDEKEAQDRMNAAAPALLNAALRIFDLIPVSDETPDESQIITTAGYWKPAAEELRRAIARTKPPKEQHVPQIQPQQS